MNILMVCDFLSEGIQDGSDRILYEHSKRLKNKGHLVKIIVSSHRQHFQKDFFSKDIEVFRYKVSENKLFRLFQMLSGARRLFEKLSKEVKFDIIDFHQPLSAFPILCAKKMNNIFKIYTFLSLWHREYEIENNPKFILYRINSVLRKKIERFCLQKCDKIVTLSEYMKNELIKTHHIDEEKIRVIPGGVDTEKFKPEPSKTQIREKLSLPGDMFIMLSARLRKRTGIIELISAARPLLERYDDLMLVIMGGGPQKAAIENLIEKLNLESRIVLTGFVDEDLLPFYYRAADLFVMPTQELEGFGLVMLEALSSGLPVLATPVGAIPEILSDLDKGCFFEGTSVRFLTEGLEEFLSNRKIMKSMAEKARGYAIMRYSWDNIIPKLEREFIGQKEIHEKNKP